MATVLGGAATSEVVGERERIARMLQLHCKLQSGVELYQGEVPWSFGQPVRWIKWGKASGAWLLMV